MNRIDRLFAILLCLQATPRIRSQDLAQRFEVSQRTIYRDMATLVEIGVPLISLPGEGYELPEGFYLPPLMFALDEAGALLLSAYLLQQQATGRVTEHIERAITRIRAVLPPRTIRQIEELTEIIQFGLSETSFNLDDPKMLAFYQAIKERRTIHIRYHSLGKNEATERTIEPEQLHYYHGAWYVYGYCRLRSEPRWFRFERIDNYKVLPERFVHRQSARSEPTWVWVQVQFQPSVLRWVREGQFHAFVKEESPTGERAVVMHYQIRPERLTEIQRWIMGWGAAAEVLEPLQLRDSIRREAARIVEMLT